jgi:hypothetical protein
MRTQTGLLRDSPSHQTLKFYLYFLHSVRPALLIQDFTIAVVSLREIKAVFDPDLIQFGPKTGYSARNMGIVHEIVLSAGLHESLSSLVFGRGALDLSLMTVLRLGPTVVALTVFLITQKSDHGRLTFPAGRYCQGRTVCRDFLPLWKNDPRTKPKPSTWSCSSFDEG